MAQRATADDAADLVEALDEVHESTKPSNSASGINAFTELMKPKPKQTATQIVDAPTRRTMYFGRGGLAAYTTDPESFPQSRVIYYDENFVVINDLFPKATVHLLILPRDPTKNVLRPQEAFDDPAFLELCRQEEKKVRALAASELRRKIGKYSASDQARRQAMEEEDPPGTLPFGRDWSNDIISGIHANPSMSHLHIHVLSREMVSDCMKKRNHYLSFTTDFFVPLSAFPLKSGDHRRNYHHFPDDMMCWRCGKNFRNKMVALKGHLEDEFLEWRKE